MSVIRRSTLAAFAFAAVIVAGPSYAEQRVWSVSRSSGEVWIASPGAQQVALSSDIKPGDTIRTGRNGRVLLVRGEESILVAPNSSIGVPKDAGDGLSTTIIQQAGSILLEVEKKNVKHFEVQTPSLAAVVKGTQFRVSVGATGTSVNVTRGQVEVAHFKTGQIAQIMPGQTATSFAHGKLGLSLSGSGNFSPIEHGKPRPSPVERLTVPKGGLTAPRQAGNGMQVRSLAQLKGSAAAVAAHQAKAVQGTPRAGVRISSAIGDVRLNFSKVTHGLARGTGPTVGSSRAAAASSETTIWSSNKGNASASVTSGNATSSANTAAPSVSNAIASVAAIGTEPAKGGDSDNSAGGKKGNNGNHNGKTENNGKGGKNGPDVADKDAGKGDKGNGGKGNAGNNGNGNGGSGNSGNGGNGGNGHGANGNGNSGNGNSGKGGGK